MDNQPEPELISHQHSGREPSVKENRFKCDICDKMFITSSYLRLHITTVHDKIKAFPCPHCPYKATQSGDLKKHILTHTRKKNFKCDLCDKKFTLKGSLKLHIRTVHNVSEFS